MTARTRLLRTRSASEGGPRWRCGFVCALFLAGTLHGAEIASNGTGGGPWSDPATWRGKTVPGAKDEVVIQKHDVVVFDRNDDGKTSCGKLLLDPKGVLLFKTGAGKLVCAVADGIESFGAIKLDGTRSPTDFVELRLVGDTAEKRRVKLGRGGGLLLYGASGLPEGQVNVALTAPQTAGQKEDLLGQVETDGGASIDWQRAHVGDVRLAAKGLDNTGARANERINVSASCFTGQGRVFCENCDTPVIANNTFTYSGARPSQAPAIGMSDCPLAEIKGNVIQGGFLRGIDLYRQTDAVVIGNTIENCKVGISGGGGLPNLMIKQVVIRGCETGLSLEGSSGSVLEDVRVEGAAAALRLQNSHLQLTNVQVKDLAPKGVAVVWTSGTLQLLNCNIAPPQIKLAPLPGLPPTHPATVVTSLQYVLVAVKEAPAGALVEVRTKDARLSADAADPNVRNSPAPVVNGQTPVPPRFNALIVKSWTLDLKGKVLSAPEYTVNVLGPAAKEGEHRPVLKTVAFRPEPHVFHERPTDPLPTLEVSLK
jgi:Right handed beta helix region